MFRGSIIATLAGIGFAGAVNAQDAQPASYTSNTSTVTQSQAADMARLGELARLQAPCDGLCIMPTVVTQGVASVAEREVISFLGQAVANGQGILIDARGSDNRGAGTIPGATHVPAAVLDPANSYRIDILMALGATRNGDTLDFSTAAPLMVFDNGPADGEAANMIAALMNAGYPASKLSYYRGGMLVWVALGLTVAETAS